MLGINWEWENVTYTILLYYIIECQQEHINDNEEEEGKGRSANRPRQRLKFQIFLTVVALLSLERWRNAHGANRP